MLIITSKLEYIQPVISSKMRWRCKLCQQFQKTRLLGTISSLCAKLSNGAFAASLSETPDTPSTSFVTVQTSRLSVCYCPCLHFTQWQETQFLHTEHSTTHVACRPLFHRQSCTSSAHRLADRLCVIIATHCDMRTLTTLLPTSRKADPAL